MSHINTYDIYMTKRAKSQTMHLKWLFLTFICSCHRFMTLILKSQRFYDNWFNVTSSCSVPYQQMPRRNKCWCGTEVADSYTKSHFNSHITNYATNTYQITNHALIILINIPTINMPHILQNVIQKEIYIS